MTPVTITEGETRTITLSLEQALRAPVTVRYAPGPGTTASAEDFSIVALPPGVTPDAQGALTLPLTSNPGTSRCWRWTIRWQKARSN